MNRSVKNYMIKDMAFLTLVGCVLEGICTAFSGLVFNGAPTICVSFLVVFLLVVRWGAYGLLSIPFLALSTIIGGYFNVFPPIAAAYKLDYTGWQMYLSIVAGLATVGIDVIFYKKMTTAKATKTCWRVIGLLLLNYLVYNLVQNLLYYGLTAIPNTNTLYVVAATETTDAKTYNIRLFGTNGIIYNLFGLFVGIVGTLILRSQGIVCNVYDKLVDDKKNAELIRLNTEQFRIEDDGTPVTVESPVNEAKKEEGPHTGDSSKI